MRARTSKAGHSTAGGGLTWAGSAALVIAAHALAAWVFLRPTELVIDPTTAGAFVIELAPLAVARPDLPAVTPGPDQVQAEAAPEPPVTRDAPPLVVAAPQATEPIPQVRAPDPDAAPTLGKIEKKEAPAAAAAPPPSPAVPVTSAVQIEAERKAAVAAAPVAGPSGVAPSVTLSRWSAQLLAYLERSKRYPATAQRRRQEGTAHVAFTIDRLGRLLSATIQKSSGVEALDTEALDMLKRAAPFPPPPSELSGEAIALAVPIRFRLQK